jgi:hypothetical protein
MSLSLGEVVFKTKKIQTLIAEMSSSEIRDVMAILEYEAWKRDNDQASSHNRKTQ